MLAVVAAAWETTPRPFSTRAQMGMVLFLISFASHLGIRWKHRSFGLALGFGFFATTELVLYAIRHGLMAM